MRYWYKPAVGSKYIWNSDNTLELYFLEKNVFIKSCNVFAEKVDKQRKS